MVGIRLSKRLGEGHGAGRAGHPRARDRRDRAGCNVVEIYSITGHKPGDVQAILTAHYLPQDGEVARNAIAKLNTYRRGRGDQKETEIFPTARPTALKIVGSKGEKA